MRSFLLFSIFFFAFIIQDGLAQNKNQLQSERNKILEEINQLNELLDRTKETRQSSLNDILILERRIILRERLIDQWNKEMMDLQSKINDNNDVIRSLEDDLKKIKDEYAKIIYYSYKNRNLQNKLMYILAAEDFNQAYKRFKYLQQYSNFRKNQVNLILAVQRTLYNQVLLLEEQIDEKEKLQYQKQQELAKIAQEKLNKEIQLTDLKSRETELIHDIKLQQEVAEKLQMEISRLITEESRKSADRSFALTPEEQLVSDDFRKNQGRLPWPTQKGIIIRGFGENDHPILKGTKIHNDGVDISTVKGAEVRALFDGEVKRVFTILGANTTIIIRHGSFLTVYHNLVDVVVKPGDQVNVKQVIGKVSSDEDSNSSTLHIEIWEEFDKLNPEVWLSKYTNT